MAKLNTNSNAYTIIYASVLVIIVAFLLAFVYSILKPTQDQNVSVDTKKQILSSLNIRNLTNEEAEKKFAKIFGDKANEKDSILIATTDSGKILVAAVTGKGLWGGINGWVSIKSDGQTINGTFFNHESETAGLGARIKDEDFQNQFRGKKLFINAEDTTIVGLSVIKAGKDGTIEYKKSNGQKATFKLPRATYEKDFIVDAVTGATLTSNGVNSMLQEGLTKDMKAINDFKTK